MLLLLVLFHRELLLVAFDREAAQAMGMPVVLGESAAARDDLAHDRRVAERGGNILVVAMLVTPAAAARLLTDRLPVMLGLSAAIGAMSGVVGLVVSYHANVAAGGTIVLVATVVFGLVWLLAPNHGLIATRLARRRWTRRADPQPPWASSPE